MTAEKRHLQSVPAQVDVPPHVRYKDVPKHKEMSLKDKIVAGAVAGIALVGFGIMVAPHVRDTQGEPPKLEFPTEGTKTILYTAKPGDIAPSVIASHFRSNDGGARLDQLTNLIQREAEAHDGDQKIQVGEAFAIPADVFHERADENQ